jgi:hypothetical protein
MTPTLFAESLSQWQEFISLVGLPGLFMVAVLALMAAVVRWIAPHARTVLRDHANLVRTLAEATEKQTEFNRRQTEATEDMARVLAQLHDAHAPDAPASTLRTNRALHYASHALYEIAEDDRKPAVRPYTEAMRRELGCD